MSKKNILFLCPYPLGQSPSQRFRFEQYFNLLESSSFTFDVRSFWNIATWQILYKKGNFGRKALAALSGFFKRLLLIFSLHKYDFVFIHREAAPLGPPLLEWIIARLFQKKIIYDFDDAIWLPNTSEQNGIISFLKWHRKVNAICRWSHKVSCGNSYLAEHARRFSSSVVINPTTIDTEGLHNPALYSEKKASSSLTIGWTGTHSTLPYLFPLVPLIDSLWKKYPYIKLVVIADKEPAWSKPFIKFIGWNKKTEIADLVNIDIGVMPMREDAWTKGKCGFKALQYMSLNKLTLASTTGVNSEIIEHGVNGFLCSTPQEWLQYLEQAINNSESIRAIAEKGRQTVIERYSVISNSSTFLSLFE